jgi:hypothetical protein
MDHANEKRPGADKATEALKGLQNEKSRQRSKHMSSKPSKSSNT